jgi:helix-turn-helix protein
MRKTSHQTLPKRAQQAAGKPLGVDGEPVSSLDEIFLTDEELASRWRLSPKTLRNARVAGTLIGFVKIGRSVRYRLSDVIAFEQQSSVRSTSGGEE